MSTKLLLVTSLLLSTAYADANAAPAETVEVALDAGVKLGGCAVGDVLPDHPGLEIVAVAVDGRVFLAYDDEGTWVSREIGRAGGELIQCAIGDVHPDRPGNEIVAVGMKSGSEEDDGPGAAVVFWAQRNGDADAGEVGFEHEVVTEDAALLHGVCIADLDPARDGDEALLVGFSESAMLLEYEDGGFTTRTVADLPGAGKNAVGFDGGAAVACMDGSVVHVRGDRDGGFTTTVLDEAEAGAARIGAAGKTLVVAYDDGTLALFADGRREEIHRDSDKLRGAVLAELDPSAAGMEAATGGYSKQLVRLTRDGDAWKATVVHQDAARIHHVAAGDVTPRAPGAEIVACGYSGRVIVVLRRDG